MSEKPSGFPLPLSRVIGGESGKRFSGANRGGEMALQTAVRNRMQPLMPEKAKVAAGGKSASPAAVPVLAGNPKRWPEPARGAVAMTEKIAALGIRDTLVLAALRTIPRHLFVASALSQQAYADTSLPIGHHQTISRPYTVARMIEAVRQESGNKKLPRVLEIGTGCGYQAAVLSQVAEQVYSIERIKALHEQAKQNLRALRLPNLRLHYGDGMLGLPQVAPFDAIVIAAAGLDVPEALFLQMAVGGYMVAPVGDKRQQLQLTKRTGERQWQSVMLEECHFVPLRQGVI
ncbi:MAG: protein-L-isoaspartate(D-aspartate) O-methyltransferase [Alistipes senegalensis]|nr:protein-L-isoaspartate(D-aspartate) O-methyltransferase [Oxalobacter formigenes]MCM1281798.1 protein-L-isoaspartate(D-aspartate) O-methyltransferase [Alistipes senegalensis]